MPIPQIVVADKTFSLVTLNTLIEQQEALLGTLTRIDNDGTQTVLTFDMEQKPPIKNAVVALTVNGQAMVPPGSNLVARGIVFINGKLKDASATRPA